MKRGPPPPGGSYGSASMRSMASPNSSSQQYSMQSMISNQAVLNQKRREQADAFKFKDLEKTKEYRETHYYSSQFNDDFQNQFS